MPRSRKACPNSLRRMLKSLIWIHPSEFSLSSELFPALIDCLNEARGLSLRSVAPTRPGIAPERASVDPLFTIVDVMSSTGLPLRKMVLIFSSTRRLFIPNWSENRLSIVHSHLAPHPESSLEQFIECSQMRGFYGQAKTWSRCSSRLESVINFHSVSSKNKRRRGESISPFFFLEY